MPTTFTTHFGSTSHGVFLEWTHDPTQAWGSKTLQCLMTANMYGDLLLASKTVTTATYYMADTIYTNLDSDSAT